MRSPKKFTLVVAILSSAFALAACGDANVGSPGEFKTAGGDPSQDPATPTGGGATYGGSGSDAGTSTGTSTTGTAGGFSLTLGSAALASELQMTTVIPVTITPTNGFTGTVTLSATGLPSGITGTFAPASVDIGAAAGTAMFTVVVPSTVTPTSTAASIMVSGSGDGGATGNAPLALTVKRAITITIPLNVEMNNTAFGSSPIVIHAGTIGSGANAITVSFVNKDTSATAGHIVHSTNTMNGFFHGDTNNPVPPNKSDALRTVTGLGDYPFYMHNENVNIGNTISIVN